MISALTADSWTAHSSANLRTDIPRTAFTAAAKSIPDSTRDLIIAMGEPIIRSLVDPLNATDYRDHKNCVALDLIVSTTAQKVNTFLMADRNQRPYKEIGQRIADLRKQRARELDKKLPQRVIAEELDVAPGTVTAWEIGKQRPEEDNVRKLARFLDTTPEFILGGQDPLIDAFVRYTAPLPADQISSVVDSITTEDVERWRRGDRTYRVPEQRGALLRVAEKEALRHGADRSAVEGGEPPEEQPSEEQNRTPDVSSLDRQAFDTKSRLEAIDRMKGSELEHLIARENLLALMREEAKLTAHRAWEAEGRAAEARARAIESQSRTAELEAWSSSGRVLFGATEPGEDLGGHVGEWMDQLRRIWDRRRGEEPPKASGNHGA